MFTPAICLITQSFLSFASFPNSRALLIPLCLHRCCQVLSLPPLLRLSLCTRSCFQPAAWLTDRLHLQRRHSSHFFYFTTDTFSRLPLLGGGNFLIPNRSWPITCVVSKGSKRSYRWETETWDANYLSQVLNAQVAYDYESAASWQVVTGKSDPT